MVVLVNYASEGYYNAQQLQKKTALKNGFDKVYTYNKHDLSREFMNEFEHIIHERRGAGYWVWKSYVIRKTLDMLSEGDYLMYLDSAAVFVNDVHILTDIMDKYDLNIMTFGPSSMEKMWTKRDAFLLMDCDCEEYTDTPQIWGGCLIVKKCQEVYDLMTEWAAYAKDRRILTDDPCTLGENYDVFRENRHDQSIFSLLCKKHGIIPFRDPSQWGTNMENVYQEYIHNGWMMEEQFPQIIILHRLGAASSMYEVRRGKAFVFNRIIKMIREKRVMETLKKIK